MAKKTITVPPFPPLRWDDFGWAGRIQLPSWAGFATRPGSRSKKVSNGTVELDVAVEDDEARTPPTAAQVQAMQHLLDNEAAVASAVLQELFEQYSDERENFDEEEGIELPELTDRGGLRPLVSPPYVHVLHVAKGGVAYVGFGFNCAWEKEHGAGVMTHLGRIVESGHAACSFEVWIAERDAKRRKRSS
jgi:hypothetical protein